MSGMRHRGVSHGLAVLLHDYGYRVDGTSLIQLADRFESERVVTRVRSLFDAAEYLAPLIHDTAYVDRMVRLTSGRGQ